MSAARTLASVALLGAMLSGCAALRNGAGNTSGTVHVGVELPLAGDAGAEGLRALDGITREIQRSKILPGTVPVKLDVRDTARGGYANPHQDEGTDTTALPAQAATSMSAFAADPTVLIVVGGLTSAIATADFNKARATGLPLVTLAPAPDNCAAVTRRSGRPLGAISIAGAASLESLATARVVGARGYRELGIMSERSADRASQALCLVDALALRHGVPRARITRPQLTSDFATLQRRARAGAIDGLVYVGPAERGVLLCGSAGTQALTKAALATMSHRGYDSRTLPADCAWIRRIVDDSAAGRAAAHAASLAIATAGRRRHHELGKITRADVGEALRGGPATPRCSSGSATHARFALVPARAWLSAPFTVNDLRCTGTHR